jgi:hypothetical protein
MTGAAMVVIMGCAYCWMGACMVAILGDCMTGAAMVVIMGCANCWIGACMVVIMGCA